VYIWIAQGEEVRVKLSALSLSMVLLAGPIAMAADDLDGVLERLKQAQSQNDAAQVKKLAVELHELASEVVSSQAPQDADEKAAWTNHVEIARSAETYGEYTLYATAIQSQPATLVDLISTLEGLNPKSKYLDEAYGPYLTALVRTGGASKVTGIAEKGLANFPENEDLLLVLADAAMTRNQSDRALVYANRLTAVLARHSRPEGVSAADWERKRSLALAHGYWTAGVVYAEKGQYMNADKNLRAALPLIQGNNAMLGAALFHLGMSNYQIGKMTLNKARVVDGARFSEQAAQMEGPYADQARHNALVMKAEAAKMR
jgi:tetratricopeptide (TPR) repeat protein